MVRSVGATSNFIAPKIHVLWVSRFFVRRYVYLFMRLYVYPYSGYFIPDIDAPLTARARSSTGLEGGNIPCNYSRSSNFS